MAAKSTFGNMVLVFAGICLVCSALLGTVYAVTKAPIEASELQKVNAAIAAVTPAFDNVPSEAVQNVEGGQIYTATLSGEPVGYAIKVSVGGFGGPLQMIVGFAPDGTIYNTSIISHAETPGLGAKIVDENCNPRTEVKGKNPAVNKLSVTKDGGEIDAITASTITSRAFLKGVNAAYDIFKTNCTAPAEEPVKSEENGQEQ
ncbi:MAG: RnfABCDGE type electron transport complex subunit G [Bacteroidales bacterium]|nr:RnfABCDGE type electron transport complex subunit G [Bacteroidales bacterium]